MVFTITDQDFGHLRKSTSDTKPEKKSHVKFESLIKSYSKNFRRGPRALATELHIVVFAIKKMQIVKLTKILDDISNPFSSNYGKHLTRSQVTELTLNLEGSNQLLHFLENHRSATNGGKMEVLKMTPNKDYITVRAPVELWESFFRTEFYFFQRKRCGNNNGKFSPLYIFFVLNLLFYLSRGLDSFYGILSAS